MSDLSALGKRWVHAAPAAEALELARANLISIRKLVASLSLGNVAIVHSATKSAPSSIPASNPSAIPLQLTDLRAAGPNAFSAPSRLVRKNRHLWRLRCRWHHLQRPSLARPEASSVPMSKPSCRLRMEEGLRLKPGRRGTLCRTTPTDACLSPSIVVPPRSSKSHGYERSGIDVVIIDHHALAAGTCRTRMPSSIRSATARGELELSSPASASFSRSVTALLKLAVARGKTDVDLRDYLDLVAVGTVADIVPLVDENRILVRRGLRQLEHIALAGASRVDGGEPSLASRSPRRTSVFVSAHALMPADVLGDAMLSRAPAPDRRCRARRWHIASELNRNNRERQSVEMDTLLSRLRRNSPRPSTPRKRLGHRAFWPKLALGASSASSPRACKNAIIAPPSSSA